MTILSIVIPVYNAEKTIERTLRSLRVISQPARDEVEAIIVDDGSSDKSMEIVETKRHDFHPMRYITLKQANQGLPSARNEGLKHCKGEWVLFLDADDELAFNPVPYLKEYPDNSSLGFSIKYFENLNFRSTHRPVFVDLKNHLDVFTAKNAFTVSSVIFKKDRIKSIFDTRYFSLEDWLFWIENPLIFEKMKIFPDETSAIIHIHSESMTSDYTKLGIYRTKVAEKILTTLHEKLTHKQKNNLFIQAQIGLLLQGEKMKMKNFFRFPCDMTLFGKLIIFVVLRKNFSKLFIYGF